MSFFSFKDLANSKNQTVIFTHVPTGKSLTFPGLIANYTDRYTVSWGQQDIFGRADSIKPYSNTRRQISFSLTVLSHSLENSIENLEKIQFFSQMMYPMYSKPLSGKGNSFGRTIKAPPLMRVRFVNMITAASGDGPLLCCMGGFQYAPNNEAGYFISANGDIFPKEVRMEIVLDPQHESELGWDSETSDFITDTFPYSTAAPVRNEDNPSGTNSTLESANEDKILS
jgi:hypothetical protein